MRFVAVHIIRPAMKSEYDEFSSTYKSVASLSTLDSRQFSQKCNQVLVQFLLGVTGKDIDTMDSLMLYRFAMCLESIYHLKNSNLILPHLYLIHI